MSAPIASRPYICATCLRARRRVASTTCYPSLHTSPNVSLRRYVQNTARRHQQQDGDNENDKKRMASQKDGDNGRPNDKSDGAMSRRLRDMSEEALETGGRTARKAVSEAGFSDELKAQLEQRIASAGLRTSEAELPLSADRHSRDIATASPWTGTESLHDANLRMLNDAHKPLRVRGGTRSLGPNVQPPQLLDTGRRSKVATGTRLANARDRSGLYSALKDDAGLDKAEREKRFQELKDRFQPHARTIVPGTIHGLSSLANERIEDAIARGQFKNLPRGKGKNIERDYNASNPFLDTTEYFMNKIIQKQEIVPPWIEKQQELVTTASKFRSRLRADWKRHAAMAIASKGGSLEDQIKRADSYAKAELITNPKAKKEERLNTVDDNGHVSQISLSGELKVPSTSDPSALETPLAEEIVAEKVTFTSSSESKTTLSPPGSPSLEPSTTQAIHVSLPTPRETIAPAPYPFRDPNWESIELAYHTAAINDLNSKTRSYNLQAPELARKPYFSLTRELNACYADVAPQLGEAIRERARKPIRKVEGFGQALSGQQGVLDKLVGEKVRVRDERVEKQYGFKQFWKELWRSSEKSV